MKVIEIKDKKTIKSIITTPELYKITYGQGIDVKDFEVDMAYRYLLITEDDKALGLFQVKEMTKTTIEVHIFMLPQYWGTGMSKEAVDLGHMWVKQQGYMNTFTMVPAPCIHMLMYLDKIKYKCCGSIKNGIVYNHHLSTLFLYTFEV